ncbi:hypothetical protein ILUMI_09355 [Ignelater luminosus]|uniref:Uncharacterized protein n=1 Tax=Ignelater luminosus TaxID=2038154 RepID=A0A8K0GF48_IGNLU|nr:hypothetical protein ILUMI_09355 [Ignelater luminosus]
MSMDKDEMRRRLRRASEQRDRIAAYLLEKPKTKIKSVLNINREKEEALQRYYLKDSQPNSEKENVFEVYDYYAEQYRSKEFKVLPHLQPYNLKPFGTGENLVFPIYNVNRSRSIVYPDTNYFEHANETYKVEGSSSYQGGSTGNQYREFSTVSTSKEPVFNKEILLPECPSKEVNKHCVSLRKDVPKQTNLTSEKTEQTPKEKAEDINWEVVWKILNPPEILKSTNNSEALEKYLSTISEKKMSPEVPSKVENQSKSVQPINSNQTSTFKSQDQQTKTNDLKLVEKCLTTLNANHQAQPSSSADNKLKLVEKCAATLNSIKQQEQQTKCKPETKTEPQQPCNQNVSTQTDVGTWKITNASFANNNLTNNDVKQSERLLKIGKDRQTIFAYKINHKSTRKTKSLPAMVTSENQAVNLKDSQTKKIVGSCTSTGPNKNEDNLLKSKKTKNSSQFTQKKNYHTAKRLRPNTARRFFNTSTSKRRKTDERSMAQAKLAESRYVCKKLSSVGTKDCPRMTIKGCKPPDISAEEGCFRDYPFVKCKKVESPYPSFSECGELYETPTCECLADYRILQPKYPIIEKLKLLKPPPPESGGEHIDGRKEQECIRKKTGQVNEGITKTCCSFNDPDNEMQGMGRLRKEQRERNEENQD